MMTSLTRRQCILGIIVAILAAVYATLPTLMAALLKHMFTAPNQVPWTRGGHLRLIDIDGMPAQALYSVERAHELTSSSFQHKQGDVWVASYVKSGTTWTIGILAALVGHPAAEYAGNLQKVTRQFCPQPELPDLGFGDDGFGHSMEQLNDWSGMDIGRNNRNYRCFKSHWPSKDHVVSNGQSKFIYVLRNAQDQLISHWNQVYGMGFHYGTEDMTFEGGWDDFVQDWLNGNVENGSYFDHVASWFKRVDDSDVLLVRFEELKRDPSRVIEQIATFIGMEDVTPTKIKNVMDLTSFERMKLADEQDMGLRFMRWLGVLRRAHVRQGEVGSVDGSRLTFSTEQLAALESLYREKLQPLGVPREWIIL
eukprot:scaffold401_cov144-Skeletonema_dohrnii-CCMP3373.AAC.13